MEKKEFKLKLSDTIKSWIELDQENIDLKSTGVTMFKVPKLWKTNIPMKPSEFKGNFKDNLSNTKEKDKFNDLLFKLLAQQINQAVSNKDVTLFNSTIQFVVDYCRNNAINDGLEISVLQFCITSGSKKLGIKSKLKINSVPKNVQ